MQDDWYKQFFHGVALDMWRRAVTPETTAAESEFLADVLEAPRGGRILDVPCGNGRHSTALAQRGYRLTGVDLAQEFVDEARAASAAAGLQVEWKLGDMRDLPWMAEFDGAFCFGNSFGYLDHAGNRAFFAALGKTLKPQGRFVLETGLAAESILPKLQERAWLELGDILFLSARQYVAAESRLEIDYTFLRDGVRDTRRTSSRVYTVAEIRRMLEEAGLATLSMYGAVDKSAYQLGSPRLLLVAEKR